MKEITLDQIARDEHLMNILRKCARSFVVDPAIDADDLVSEFLIHLGRKLKQFDPSKRVKLNAWIYYIGRNFFIERNQAHKRKRDPVQEIDSSMFRLSSNETATPDLFELQSLSNAFEEYLIEHCTNPQTVFRATSIEGGRPIPNIVLIYRLILKRIDNPELTFRELVHESPVSYEAFYNNLERIRRHFVNFLERENNIGKETVK